MDEPQNTFELFDNMSAALFGEIMEYFYQYEKDAIKMAVQTMSINRKLRPVFIQRKPPQERFPWIKRELGKKYNGTISDNLLQTWFMQSQQKLLTTFLDSLGIEHDEGSVDDMPETVDKEELKKAVDAIIAEHSPEKATLYLLTIRAMDMAQWPEIAELIEEDDRLYLGEKPADKPAAKTAATPAKAAKKKAAPTKDADAAPEAEALPKAKAKVEAAEETAEKEPAKGVEPAAADDDAKPAKPKK